MADATSASNAEWFARAQRASRAGWTRPCGPSPRWEGRPTPSPRERAPTCATSRATGTSTSCSPTARCCSATRTRPSPPPSRRRRRTGTTFGAPTPGEVLLAEAICAAGAGLRAGTPRLLGDRGGDERRTPGSRGDRARPCRQVRRLLSRSLRRLAGRRRQRRRHARPAGLGRRLRRRGGRHRGRPLQRGAGARRAGGLRHRRAGGGEHEPGRARTGISRRAAGRVRCRGRPPRLRRGHHGLPPGRGRRDRMVGRDARPVVLRQGDRRWAPRRCVRRRPRPDGRAGAGRSGVPGRHLVGEPARHGGGAGRARRGRPGGLRGAGRPRRRVRQGSRVGARRGRPGRVGADGRTADRPLRRPRGRRTDRPADRLRGGPGARRQRRPTRASSTPCSAGAWRSPPAPTR